MPAHFSALGMLLADLRHDFAFTLASPLDVLSAARLREAFATLEEEARTEVGRSMPEARDVRLSRLVEQQRKALRIGNRGCICWLVSIHDLKEL